MRRYIELLAKSEGVELDLPQIPDEPHALAYLLRSAYRYRTTRSKACYDRTNSGMLERLSVVYRREVALLRAALRQKPGSIESFSMN